MALRGSAVKRDTPWRALLAAQLSTSLVAASFHWGLRPELANRYSHAGIELVGATRLALATPTVIGVAGIGSLVALGAALGIAQRGRKLRVIASAVAVTGCAFVAGVIAAVWPFTSG
jgi:hypothetical protein